MRKLYLLLASIGILGGFGIAYAAPNVNIFRNIHPETDSLYYNGTTTAAWLGVVSDGYCLTGDSCITSWPTGGGGGGSGGGWATSTTANGDIIKNTFGNAVGINSTTPWGHLVVQGKAGSTTPIFIVSTSTGASFLTVLANGNVGIGSTSPTSVLTIQGSSASPTTNPLIIASSTGTSLLTVTPAGSIELNGHTTGNVSLTLYYDKVGLPSVYSQFLQLPAVGTYISSSGAGAGFDGIFLQNDGGVRLTVATGGNVGIATTTPGRTLSVVGDIRATGILYDSSNSSGTNGFILKSTGTGYSWVATSTVLNTTGAIGSSFSGSGSAISAQATSTVSSNFAGTITGYRVSGFTAAGAVCNFQSDVYKNASKISAVAPVTLSSATSTSSSSLTGWTTTVAIGDVFWFVSTSTPTCVQATPQLDITKS
jgi:hypothetical protein